MQVKLHSPKYIRYPEKVNHEKMKKHLTRGLSNNMERYTFGHLFTYIDIDAETVSHAQMDFQDCVLICYLCGHPPGKWFPKLTLNVYDGSISGLSDHPYYLA